MSADSSYIQINAAFIDRLIQRWEVLVEHHIRVRHEGYDPSEDEGAAAIAHPFLFPACIDTLL